MSRYAPQWMQQNAYSAQRDRDLMTALWPAGGAGGAAPSKVAGTKNLNIPAGQCAVPLQGTGVALCTWDATEVVTLEDPPASGQSRYDLVIALVRDVDGPTADFIFTYVKGTAAPSNPVVPTLPPNSYLVAQVLVPGGVANLDTATLTDRRSWYVGATDPAWITLPLSPPWAQYPGSPVPQYRRINGLCYLRGYAGGGTAQGSALGVLPVPYRPLQAISWPVRTYTTLTLGLITVQPNGNVQVNSVTTPPPTIDYVTCNIGPWTTDQ